MAAEKPFRVPGSPFSAKRETLFGKDLRFKGVDGRFPILPRGFRQTGFSAGLSQKRNAVPAKLRSHLRQQKSPKMPLCNIEPVFANLDFLDALDMLERGQNGNLDA
jgi:hypothetical protein